MSVGVCVSEGLGWCVGVCACGQMWVLLKLMRTGPDPNDTRTINCLTREPQRCANERGEPNAQQRAGGRGTELEAQCGGPEHGGPGAGEGEGQADVDDLFLAGRGVGLKGGDVKFSLM